MTAGDFRPADLPAEEWIGEIGLLRRHTRRARQAFWPPLLLLGALTLAAIPLYLGRSEAAQLGLPAGVTIQNAPLSQLGPPKAGLGDEEVDGRWYAVPACRIVNKVVYEPCDGTFAPRAAVDYFPAGYFTTSPRAVALFWLIALSACYGLIGLWYRLRARRRGVATRALPFVLTGIGLLGLLVLTTPHVAQLFGIGSLAGFGGGSFNVRGLAPLITIGVALVVLSWFERSRGLFAFAVGFLALAVAANLYNFENMAYRVGINVGGVFAPAFGLCLAGLVLTLGGAAFGLGRRFSE